jgi:hypothetical protein
MRIYIESTIPSYVVARPASNLLQAARQQVTKDWWDLNRSNILLSWNCRHIANAAIQTRLRRLVAQTGFALPVLCTPDELSGELYA